MQTEPPRGDGGLGVARIAAEARCDRNRGWPCIATSENPGIRAEFTVLEQHVGTDARSKLTSKPAGELAAAHFEDSVAVGSYRIDLHPSSGGENYVDISSLHFEIPIGSLIPRRVENLLAAKNLGVTYITNGCYHLHPVEWNTDKSAALLATRAI
jgi:hypothetical protein